MRYLPDLEEDELPERDFFYTVSDIDDDHGYRLLQLSMGVGWSRKSRKLSTRDIRPMTTRREVNTSP